MPPAGATPCCSPWHRVALPCLACSRGPRWLRCRRRAGRLSSPRLHAPSAGRVSQGRRPASSSAPPLDRWLLLFCPDAPSVHACPSRGGVLPARTPCVPSLPCGCWLAAALGCQLLSPFFWPLRTLPHPTPPRPAAHPHTKLATLVYCESLCCDVSLVGELLNGETGPALVGSAPGPTPIPSSSLPLWLGQNVVGMHAGVTREAHAGVLRGWLCKESSAHSVSDLRG